MHKGSDEVRRVSIRQRGYYWTRVSKMETRKEDFRWRKTHIRCGKSVEGSGILSICMLTLAYHKCGKKGEAHSSWIRKKGHYYRTANNVSSLFMFFHLTA